MYANFTASKTIATFAQSNCALTFLGDVPAVGLQGGSVTGMAVRSNILVVAYGDGSIQSFNVANGLPVSNGDLQNATGFAKEYLPSGVDITQDGRFAVFGDVSSFATVEVSSLSSGKLSKTIPYSLGRAPSAATLALSPDQSLLYVVNSEGGTVQAAFFNKTTGVVTPGCISRPLTGFDQWPYLGAIASRDTTGTGGVLYVSEYGFIKGDHGEGSAIGILTVTVNGQSCTLAESANSPVVGTYPAVLSLAVYPPRPF